MTLSAGVKLGPYEVLALLGAGGMGEVYRAKDPRLGREVAIYVFRRDAIPARVVRLDVDTGRRSLWKEIVPRDPTGAVGLSQLVVTPDGRSYFYSYQQTLADLFLVAGVR